MDLLRSKTVNELHQSLEAEVSKTKNEMRCAIGDLKKVTTRAELCLALINELQQRGNK